MGIDIKNNKFFFISIGAIFGALFRWHVDQIFLSNLIGCFLLGFFNSLNISKKYKLILEIGLCGSMTTFSGWSFYLNELLSKGLYKIFLFNSVKIVLLGVFAMGLGHMIGKKINS
tara:strand:- start:491 stop:835 length:345 start_codon:yes stop_codon:yes gene_type:complete